MELRLIFCFVLGIKLKFFLRKFCLTRAEYVPKKFLKARTKSYLKLVTFELICKCQKRFSTFFSIKVQKQDNQQYRRSASHQEQGRQQQKGSLTEGAPAIAGTPATEGKPAKIGTPATEGKPATGGAPATER
jgi:hypothetical protein